MPSQPIEAGALASNNLGFTEGGWGTWRGWRYVGQETRGSPFHVLLFPFFAARQPPTDGRWLPRCSSKLWWFARRSWIGRWGFLLCEPFSLQGSLRCCFYHNHCCGATTTVILNRDARELTSTSDFLLRESPQIFCVDLAHQKPIQFCVIMCAHPPCCACTPAPVSGGSGRTLSHQGPCLNFFFQWQSTSTKVGLSSHKNAATPNRRAAYVPTHSFIICRSSMRSLSAMPVRS